MATPFTLNIDHKTAWKAVAERLKKILPVLISHEQRASVKDKFVCETGRWISDIRNKLCS